MTFKWWKVTYNGRACKVWARSYWEALEKLKTQER